MINSSHPRFSITFDNQLTAQVLKVQSDQDIALALSAMNLNERRPVLVLIGGASRMSEKDLWQLESLFMDILAPLAQKLDLLVVDGGTDAGVMSLMGKARQQTKGTFPLIGVSPLGLIKFSDENHPSADAACLEPHHSHFFLIPGSQWGDESPWLAQIASTLAGEYPSVAVLISGGAIALVDAMENVKLNRPLIAIAGSGRLADEIATSISHPEQEMRQEIALLLKSGEITIFNLSDSLSQFEQLLREKLAKSSLQ